MSIERKLSHLEFLNREYDVSHLSYEHEMAFFHNVQMGNRTEALRLLQPLNSERLGRLSDDALCNLKYHLIITIALMTRYCIEGGMEMVAAYNLSDVYIRTLDKLQSEEEIQKLHHQIVEAYLKKMEAIHHANRYPRAIIICMDYIYENLHRRMTLDELAGLVKLSPTYLSRLFRKEVGVTISSYIIGKRVEAAKNMLKYSDYSCSEISNYLCFHSESRFIEVFRKATGYTPRKYREAFFRVH